jgi:hypothetical protein
LTATDAPTVDYTGDGEVGDPAAEELRKLGIDPNAMKMRSTGEIGRDPLGLSADDGSAAEGPGSPKAGSETKLDKQMDNLRLGVNEDFRDAIRLAAIRTGTDPAALAGVLHAEASGVQTMTRSEMNEAANQEFWDAHPEMRGQPIPADRKDLAAEWLAAFNRYADGHWDVNSYNSRSKALEHRMG